jgi:L-threonylcarbamoyladenylate synthase
MKVEVLPANDPESISRAVRVLQRGGLIAFATDTVYGLGTLAFNPQAINRIYKVKERSRENPIPVLMASSAELPHVAVRLSSLAMRLAEHFWPGPVTLVVLRNPRLPDEISVFPTVGVRVPDHPSTQALLDASGPLAVTSANRSGRPSPCTAEEVLRELGGRIDLLLDDGRTPGGAPSTVIDCTQSKPRILREGPVREEDIQAALA